MENAPSFFTLPPDGFLLLSFIVSMILACTLGTDRQNSLGNFLSSVGQNLSTSAGQLELLESADKQGGTERQREELENRIKKLEELVDKLTSDD